MKIAKRLLAGFTSTLIGLLIGFIVSVPVSVWAAPSSVDQLIGFGMSPELAKYLVTVVNTLASPFPNNTWVTFTDNAGSGTINVLKVNSGDDTVINSSASDLLQLQLEDDANRTIQFSAASDAALIGTWGDGGTTATQNLTLEASTSDGDDDSSLILCGGGGTAGTRGACIALPGEEVSGGSDITYNAGTGDTHIFSVAGTAEVTISDDALTFSGASASVAFGATSGIFKINGNTELTLADDTLTFAGAAAKIVPGATSLTFRNNADSGSNLAITDAGIITTRNNVVFGTALKGVVRDIATLAGAGTNQGNAAAIAHIVSRVTGADGTVGVVLPALSGVTAGLDYLVINSDTTNALKIYASGSDTITGQAGSTAISLAAKLQLRCTAYDSSNWYCEKGVTPY